jgi:hypothetical protein
MTLKMISNPPDNFFYNATAPFDRVIFQNWVDGYNALDRGEVIKNDFIHYLPIELQHFAVIECVVSRDMLISHLNDRKTK